MKRMTVILVAVALLCLGVSALAATSHVYLEKGVNYVGFYVVPETDDIYQLVPGLQRAEVWDRNSQKLVELGHSGLKYYAATNSGFILNVNLAEPVGLEVVGEPLVGNIYVVSGWNFIVNPVRAFYNFVQKDDNVKALWVMAEQGFSPVSPEDYEVGDGTPFWVLVEEDGALKLKNSLVEPSTDVVFAENFLSTKPPTWPQ